MLLRKVILNLHYWKIKYCDTPVTISQAVFLDLEVVRTQDKSVIAGVKFRGLLRFSVAVMWEKIKQALFNPSVNDDVLTQRLREVTENLPVPVFWLLGKTQSGKTAIVRALTGHEQAQIGNGYQSCTRYSKVYDFPDSANCMMRFLDTRGIGEVEYDASEEIQLFSQQTHVLIVVMKAMDHAQKSVMDSLVSIQKQRPDWPVIVAQTCLHEGYDRYEDEHIDPYPYFDLESSCPMPEKLVRSLSEQRDMVQAAGIQARYVALDFTQPDDGYTPVYYGLEAFWSALEFALPQGTMILIRDAKQAHEQISDLYRSTAHPHIVSYSVVSAMVGAIPAPFVDVPLVVAIQFKLFQTIASIYAQPLTRDRINDIGSAIGVGFLTNLSKRQLLKFVPIYGSAAASLITAASTYALGKTLDYYFSHTLKGSALESQIYQAIYQEQFEKGKALMKSYMDASTSNPRDKP